MAAGDQIAFLFLRASAWVVNRGMDPEWRARTLAPELQGGVGTTATTGTT